MKMLVQHNDGLDLQVYFPQGILAKYVQGIWIAAHQGVDTNNVTRYLKANGCNAITFCLKGHIAFDSVKYAPGVYLQPATVRAKRMTFSSNTLAVGVCLQPGAMSLFSPLPNEVTCAGKTQGEKNPNLRVCFDMLQTAHTPYALLTCLYRYFMSIFAQAADFNPTLLRVLPYFSEPKSLQSIAAGLPVGQRQLERVFKQAMGITAKQYQRIVRVNKTVQYLRCNPSANLIAVAYQFGYSDQAHMTREFKSFTHYTPSYYIRA